MLHVIYKSARSVVFAALLLFAGAIDIFSVDLDNDGNIDTDVVACDLANSASESASTADEDSLSVVLAVDAACVYGSVPGMSCDSQREPSCPPDQDRPTAAPPMRT